jgi:hypothetical protein
MGIGLTCLGSVDVDDVEAEPRPLVEDGPVCHGDGLADFGRSIKFVLSRLARYRRRSEAKKLQAARSCTQRECL